MMKNTIFYLAVSIMMVMLFACNQSETKTEVDKTQETKEVQEVQLTADAGDIEVYYFHFTRRCATCNAVEDVAKEALQEHFADRVKNGAIVFKSYNLDEEDAQKIADGLEVAGQNLLLVSGDKHINLTDDAFMYARDTPDKLKVKVKTAVEELLN